MKRPTPEELDDPSASPWFVTTMAGFVGSGFDHDEDDGSDATWTFECSPDYDTGDVVVKASRNKSLDAPATLTITLVPHNAMLASTASEQVQQSVLLKSDMTEPTIVPICHMSSLMEQPNPFVSPKTGKFELHLAVFWAAVDANGVPVPPTKRSKTDPGSSPTGFDDAVVLGSELSLLDPPLDDGAKSDSGLVDLTMNVNYDSKTATGMVGLKNQGATCYMNSLLETLFYLRPFRKAVYDTPTADDDSTNSVALALQRVFYRLETSVKAVSTKELTKAFGWSHMDAFTQHDVQELYRILCDRLEDKMKDTPVDGLIPALFEGKVTSFVSCVNVDCTSSREESFYDLQLDVKGCANLDASFQKFVEVEMLDGDNQYDAANGFGKQDAKKGLSFQSFPPILNIQLKRFEYDPMRDGMVKVHDRFEFPKELNLAAYMDKNAAPDSTKYHLHSILVHSGDVHGGHYYVYIRPHGQDPTNSSWYNYDDDLISAVDEKTVMETSFGSPYAGVTSFSSAYMLVYVQTGVGTVEHAIPPALATRFQAEEVAARRRKRLAQREHLFFQVRIATDDSVARFRRITRSLDFVVLPKANKVPLHLLSCKVLKTNTLQQLYGQVHMETGVPINAMRLWKMATRENQTTRPDEALDNYPLDSTCAMVLEEDSHTKQVLLFLEILGAPSSSLGRIKRFHMQAFTPLTPDEPDAVDDADDDLAPPQLHPLAADAATRRVPQPVPQNSMLLFLKQYDPTLPTMSDRLTYVGNVLLANSTTVSDLVELIQLHIDAPDTPLDMYEQLQPEAINLLDTSSATLLECELQHGDILIFQNETTALTLLADDHANQSPAHRQYATAPLYFEYLLNRIDVVFYPIGASPAGDAVTLTCLLTQTYDDVVTQLAAHVPAAIDALHLRLYPHGASVNGPKDTPFQHRLCTGDQVTLRGMVDNFTTNHHAYSLYYEVLPTLSIVELERMVKWAVHLSPFEPSFQGQLEVDLLLNPTDTVADALALLQTQLAETTPLASQSPPPPLPAGPVTLHLMETRDRTTILKFLSPTTLVANVLLSPSAPLFVDAVPATHDDERGATLGVVGVMHYHTNSATWIRTHSTPCVLPVFELDTVRHVRQRLQQRMHIPDDEFATWKLAAIFDHKAFQLGTATGTEPEYDTMRVTEWLEKLGLRIGKGLYFGLEHAPAPLKLDQPRRRQELGIKIRAS